MTVISRKYNFIYLKSHKTASSSIEAFLIDKTPLGNDIYSTSRDILKLNAEYEINKKIFYLSITDSWFHIPKKFYIRGTSKLFPHIIQHMTASETKKIIGTKFWDNAIISTSVRNPWDAILSFYNWVKIGRYGRDFDKDLSFTEFLDKVTQIDVNDKYSLAQNYLFYPYIMIDDEYILSHVFYFESLQESFKELEKKLKLKIGEFDDVRFKFKNKRLDKDYRREYNDRQAELVNNHFKEYLKIFPYNFNKPNAKPSNIFD